MKNERPGLKISWWVSQAGYSPSQGLWREAGLKDRRGPFSIRTKRGSEYRSTADVIEEGSERGETEGAQGMNEEGNGRDWRPGQITSRGVTES